MNFFCSFYNSDTSSCTSTSASGIESLTATYKSREAIINEAGEDKVDLLGTLGASLWRCGHEYERVHDIDESKQPKERVQGCLYLMYSSRIYKLIKEQGPLDEKMMFKCLGEYAEGLLYLRGMLESPKLSTEDKSEAINGALTDIIANGGTTLSKEDQKVLKRILQAATDEEAAKNLFNEFNETCLAKEGEIADWNFNQVWNDEITWDFNAVWDNELIISCVDEGGKSVWGDDWKAGLEPLPVPGRMPVFNEDLDNAKDVVEFAFENFNDLLSISLSHSVKGDETGRLKSSLWRKAARQIVADKNMEPFADMENKPVTAYTAKALEEVEAYWMTLKPALDAHVPSEDNYTNLGVEALKCAITPIDGDDAMSRLDAAMSRMKDLGVEEFQPVPWTSDAPSKWAKLKGANAFGLLPLLTND